MTEKGLFKIISITASMNNGLSEELEVAFPNITPVQRPVITTNEIPDFNWLALDSVDGEGCFNINIMKSKTHKISFQVVAKFILTQHLRDLKLMKKLVQFLGCGTWSLEKINPVSYLTIAKLS